MVYAGNQYCNFSIRADPLGEVHGGSEGTQEENMEAINPSVEKMGEVESLLKDQRMSLDALYTQTTILADRLVSILSSEKSADSDKDQAGMSTTLGNTISEHNELIIRTTRIVRGINERLEL